MKRTIQIGTILFALIMLAAYVVYSQRQQTRTVAPSSKGMVLPDGEHGIPAGTNRAIDVSSNLDSTLVFPGSKSAAIFTPAQPKAPAVIVTNVPTRPASSKVAPSSKSGRVFDPESTSAASRTALSSSDRPSSQPSAAVTNRTATEKRASRTNPPTTSTTPTRP